MSYRPRHTLEENLRDRPRAVRPHLRCGICDDKIEQGEPTRYVDDERCHEQCAEEADA